MTKTLKHNPRTTASGKTPHRLEHTRHPERYEAEEKAKEKAEDLRKQTTADMRNCFGTPAGVRVLRHLATFVGHNKTPVVGSAVDGTLDPLGCIHNAAMQKVFLEIWQFLPNTTRNQIED